MTIKGLDLSQRQ